MYSGNAKSLILKCAAKIGDRVLLTCGSESYEGLLMPRIESGDTSCVVIKLDSGYNVGMDSKGADMKVVKKSAEKQKMPPQSGMIDGPLASHISLLSTGGTISSKIEYKTGAVSPALSASDLANANPRLVQAAPINVKSLMSIFSEDMMPSLWEKIAHGVADEFSDGSLGVVVAHGTDTMGYTAAALSYALQNLPGPVILTGSQRSSDRGSSDAGQNLLCSSFASRADFAHVALCMHEATSDTFNSLHIGTRVRKSHTSTRAAFKSVGISALARVNAESGQVQMLWKEYARRSSSKPKISAKFSSNVHLAWMYPGISPKTVEKWSEYDGVVIAGTGLGHISLSGGDANSPHSLLKPISELVGSGVVVAMAPQTMGGRVHLQTYSTGRLLANAGVIGHGADWLLETAFVKMCWALGQSKDAKKVAEIMMKPTAYDITERSEIGELD